MYADCLGVMRHHPLNMRRSVNAGSMLARHLRRRSNIESTMGKRLVFAEKWLPSKHETLAQRWLTVGPPSTTLAQQ